MSSMQDIFWRFYAFYPIIIQLYLSEKCLRNGLSDNYSFIFVGKWVKKCVFRQLYECFRYLCLRISNKIHDYRRLLIC